MKKREVESMIRFIHRQDMYIHPIHKDTLVSFMHGVDFGRDKKPLWTDLLKEFISSKYKINGGALGWPNQIEMFSKKNDWDWVATFNRLMLELIKESDHIPFTQSLQELNRKLSPK